MPKGNRRTAEQDTSTGEYDSRLDIASQLVDPGEDEGVFSSRMSDVAKLLCAFASELGGDIEGLSDLPFTEESGTDGMPEQLYVRHDDEMLNQLTSWLLQRQHIGLISPYGTGKTALREIAVRDLGSRDDFIVTIIENPNATTERALYETVIMGAKNAGYEIDPTNYSQMRNGIPWATAETREAVGEVVRAAAADDVTILLIIDEIEDFPAELLSPMQTAGDLGVRLFLTGTPDGKRRLAKFRDTLDSRLRYYEEIEPFSPLDVAEYISRSFAYMRDEPYEGEDPPLFTADAIRLIHDLTDGNPRGVRLECMDLFARAAFVWHRSDRPVERINITPALRQRKISMS